MLGERDEALGQVWHIPSPGATTTRQFVEIIFEQIGKPARIQVAPKLILRGIALFNSNLRELLEMLYQFEELFVLDSHKFESSFGMKVTSVREAVRQTLSWYRRNH